MSVKVTTTGGTIVSTSTGSGTSVSLTASSTSVSVASPSANSVSITSKGPKGDTGATGNTGPTGPEVSGVLLEVNNLSDLLDTSVARTNIGLGNVPNTDFTSAVALNTDKETNVVQTTITGNAGTATLAADATTLATPRAINGVDFDGSAPITVTAAGSTLSDTVTVAKGGTGLTTVASNTILTGNGTSALTSEANLKFASNRITIGQDEDITPMIRFQNDENVVNAGISRLNNDLVSGSTDGDFVVNSTGDHNILFGQNNTVAAKIDTDGVFTSKTFSYISCGFFDDLITSLHYLPLNGAPSEQTTEGSAYTDWIAPCAVTVLSAQMRFAVLSDTTDTDGNFTMTVWKDPIGSGTKVSVEAETVAVNVNDDNNVIHFLFDGASIAKGEVMKISIQSDTDITGYSNNFVTIVLLMDWSDRYTVASAVIAS